MMFLSSRSIKRGKSPCTANWALPWAQGSHPFWLWRSISSRGHSSLSLPLSVDGAAGENCVKLKTRLLLTIWRGGKWVYSKMGSLNQTLESRWTEFAGRFILLTCPCCLGKSAWQLVNWIWKEQSRIKLILLGSIRIRWYVNPLRVWHNESNK